MWSAALSSTAPNHRYILACWHVTDHSGEGPVLILCSATSPVRFKPDLIGLFFFFFYSIHLALLRHMRYTEFTRTNSTQRDRSYQMTKQWSEYQQNVFRFIENPEAFCIEQGIQVRKNAIVQAVAGSGKTTTIVEANHRASRFGTSAFFAFNKAIADELKARGVNARTYHSLCYGAVMEFKGARETDQNKDRRVFRATCPRSFPYEKTVVKLVSLAKNMGIGCLVPDTQDAWLSLIRHHDLDLDNLQLDRVLEMASDVLQAHMDDYAVNFDDMLYIAVRERLNIPKFDFIFVDEAQDTNAIQRALIKLCMRENTRLIAVGDRGQAIYGFRGADSDSMDIMAREFEMAELPLTISYRCPTSVVKYAQQWMPAIEARPGAPEGVVKVLGQDWKRSDFKPGDLIVCRTSRQIVTLGFKMIRDQIPVSIMGREIGEGLKALVRKMNALSVDDLEVKIKAWRDREVEAAMKAEDEVKAESIYDKAEAIESIVEGLTEDMRTLDQVFAVLDYLFHQSPEGIVLATIHKSKGLEAKRVFWLNRSQCPARWAKQPWQKQQELNLMYVAATRAMEELYLIEEQTSIKTRNSDVVAQLFGEYAASVAKDVGGMGDQPPYA